MKLDIPKTRAYYRRLGPQRVCRCDDCQNYCAQVKRAYPEAARYLASLGVDIKVPFALVPLEPDAQGYLEYTLCQYIVFGACPEDYVHRVGDVTVTLSHGHPNTKIPSPHFVLDLSPIRLPFQAHDPFPSPGLPAFALRGRDGGGPRRAIELKGRVDVPMECSEALFWARFTVFLERNHWSFTEGRRTIEDDFLQGEAAPGAEGGPPPRS